MNIRIYDLSESEADEICRLQESHFTDFKSKRITPRSLTKTLSAFANAEGGTVFIGIEDDCTWDGFDDIEQANAHITVATELFPMGDDVTFDFLRCDERLGVVLKVECFKSKDVVFATDKIAYLRRSAQNLPQKEGAALERLKLTKGITSYETRTTTLESEALTDSEIMQHFLTGQQPFVEAYPFLKKQRVLIKDAPTVSGVLLFDDLPQAVLPKRSGVKIYRYQSSESEGERAKLVFDPITIEGPLTNLITESVAAVVQIIEEIRVDGPNGLHRISYPQEALHEIVTNAVIHRDYSIQDDIHIRIFDNRVEIQSPGKLPAHVTEENILEERYSRNGVIVRLINKFPNPPNKDVGEGLNTAFEAMQTMRLKPPVVKQKGMNVVVSLRHESLASAQELILEYLSKNGRITNKEARQICNEDSENKTKHVLGRMAKAGTIKKVTGKTVFDTFYVLPDV